MTPFWGLILSVLLTTFPLVLQQAETIKQLKTTSSGFQNKAVNQGKPQLLPSLTHLVPALQGWKLMVHNRLTRYWEGGLCYEGGIHIFMTLRIFSSFSFCCILKLPTYLHLAREMRKEETGVRNETINKPVQDSPLLWAFLLRHTLIFFRVQHIEVDCFGCSCSWFLALVLASGVQGRVHPLPVSQAQCREAHQHHLPSKKLVLFQEGIRSQVRWQGCQLLLGVSREWMAQNGCGKAKLMLNLLFEQNKTTKPNQN